MEQIRIENNLDNYFREAWRLYENSFPLEERRLINSQVKLFKNLNYNFDIIIKEEKFIGFILWWEFDNLRYIEYFATVESLRNKGFGKLIIEKFIKRSQKPIILEVELPQSAIKKRRINFYERLGFQLNNHFYEIAPMHEGFSALKLLIMSFPYAISEEDVSNFTEQCHPIIFKE
jgi:GNAT superfamily N-acetyltransferase